MLAILLMACSGSAPDDTSATGDDTGRAPIDVECALVERSGEMEWGAWLEGRHVPGDSGRCDNGEACELSDGRLVEAAWRRSDTQEWIDGYQWVANDADAPTERAFTYVQQDSPSVDACRIMLR